MLESLRARYHALFRRVRRFERREIREFRRWIEHTQNLIHLTTLLFVPLLIAGATAFSNAVDVLPFVLFPPLASGTYTLFADPEGKYASPKKFVGGLTAGALCGTAAIWIAMHTPLADPLSAQTLTVSPAAAALAVFLTGIVTWALDFEEPAAFSTALLAILAPAFSNPVSFGGFFLQFAGSVFLASSIVASVFTLWRDQFYEQRAQYLYHSTQGDDHVIVPVRGEQDVLTAMFAARIAAAHEAGKVVLLGIVSEETVSETEEEIADGERGSNELDDTKAATNESLTAAEAQVGEDTAAHLERLAGEIKTKIGVPCEVVVTADGTAPAKTITKTARETNCDLIVAPYEEEEGATANYLRRLFRGDRDVILFQPNERRRANPDDETGLTSDDRTRWRRIMVPVRTAGELAHVMIDFAHRLAGQSGSVSVCSCIVGESERRAAETTLANLIETFHGSFETRVSRSTIEEFLATNAAYYDLVIIGASTDRSKASRLLSPPTFERVRDVDTDVAIVHSA